MLSRSLSSPPGCSDRSPAALRNWHPQDRRRTYRYAHISPHAPVERCHLCLYILRQLSVQNRPPDRCRFSGYGNLILLHKLLICRHREDSSGRNLYSRPGHLPRLAPFPPAVLTSSFVISSNLLMYIPNSSYEHLQIHSLLILEETLTAIRVCKYLLPESNALRFPPQSFCRSPGNTAFR